MSHGLPTAIILPSLLFLLSAPSADAEAAAAEETEFFESRIRPVLAQECYECHRSGGKVKGGLVLDYREGLLKGGDSGPSIVPGNAGASLLLQAIRHEHEKLKMPQSGAKLDDRTLRDFARWIDEGAVDPRDQPATEAEVAADTEWKAILERRKSWWSFQPIQKPQVPSGASDSANPVDDFVRKELDAAGLAPAKPAKPEVLARRLWFTLTGLPPEPQELERFLEGYRQGPDAAVRETVDDLLTSPHFGERWARHWMDWVRYADSHGSEGDPAIPHAYEYRDYLIRALNADVPADQLIREHIAGDLLPAPRLNEQLGVNESAIGPAHWRMVFHGFAPTDALDEKVRFTDDQINVFSKAFLGLTVSCARCHDHKFDAISQADYYALFGILDSTRPALIDAVPAPRREKELREMERLKGEIRQELRDYWLLDGAAVANLLEHPPVAIKDPSPTHLVTPWRRSKKAASKEEITAVWRELQDQVRAADRQWEDYLTRGDVTVWDAEDFSGWSLEDQAAVVSDGSFSIANRGEFVVQGVYPAGVYSHMLTDRLRSVTASPRFKLDGKRELWLQTAGDGEALARYVVQSYPRSGTVYPVKALKEGQWEWVKYDLTYWEGDRIHVEMATAADTPVLAKTGAERSWFGLRRVILQDAGSPPPPQKSVEHLKPLVPEGQPLPATMAEVSDRYRMAFHDAITAWSEGVASAEQAALLQAALDAKLLIHNSLPQEDEALREKINRYRQLESSLPAPRRVPGLAEADAADHPLFLRGDHKQPGDPVPRRFLEAIDATPYRTAGSGRLELAEDLLRLDNPFTARVLANRLWHHLFGAGIVTTPDNFGRMGAKPSHPELLDWLADELRENGWSMKDLIRLIVTSETWRQDSTPLVLAQEIDPENALLSHFSVRRLEAEAIRDSLMAVSGRLEPEMFGPGVGDQIRRRSVYREVFRNRLDPFLEVFDAPVPFATKGRRDVTNVPAQSLTLLNDPFVILIAEDVAERVWEMPEPERIEALFRLTLARQPSAAEADEARRFLDALETDYAEMQEESERLKQRTQLRQEKLQALLEPARQALLKESGTLEGASEAPVPTALWDFEGDLEDQLGSLHGEAGGNARTEGGALVLDGKSWVTTSALERETGARTLEAVVQLDDTSQAGAGVVTIQNTAGNLFDSIVFAERRPLRWLAGSNGFVRTEDFQGYDETDATTVPVHLTIVWEEDGTIRGYRNGNAYGEGIRKAGLQRYAAGDSHLLFGMRHGKSATGNRMLRGRIFEARFHDRALSAREVHQAASASGYPPLLTKEFILERLTPDQQTEVSRLEAEISSLQAEMEALPEVTPLKPWADLSHALFNLKEFIYLR